MTAPKAFNRSNIRDVQSVPRVHEPESLLAAIVENSDDAVVTKELDGTIISWNEAATQMYGYRSDEAIGRNIEDTIIPPDGINDERKIRQRIAKGERVAHYETVRRRKNGSLIEISMSISPVRGSNGNIVAAAGFARDLSERDRALRMRQHLAAIVANSDDAIVSKELDGTIISWNDSATRMYGYTSEDAIGRNIEDLIIIPDGVDEERKIRQRIAKGERVEHYETTRRRRDGSFIEISMSISPLRDAAGKVVAAAGVARDISERKLVETNQFLAAIVENSDDAIVSMKLDGKILSWNEAATHMYGYSSQEAVGRNIEEIIIRPNRFDEERKIRQAIANGDRVEHYVTDRRRKDGSLIDISMSISPVRDAVGNVVAAADFARDISELKRLEAERESARGLLERFVDFTSHDFKAPLHRAQYLAEEVSHLVANSHDARVRTYASQLVANCKWMHTRTERLLKIVSLRANQQSPREEVNTERAFDEEVQMLRSVDSFVPKATVTRGSLPTITSHRELLGFLFSNLIQNACKYHRLHVLAKVHASARRTDMGWQFTIEDNGVGIEPHLQQKIFEPYVRAPSVNAGGTGLGLNFCFLIVKWHRGEIWVDSVVGTGSRFHFTIPE